MHLHALLVAIALCASPSVSSLAVTGPGGTLPLDVVSLRLLAVQKVTATDPNDKETVVYTSVPLTDVLALVGAPRGDALRAKAMATYVVAEASDGYQAVFSMAELDAGSCDTKAYVAFERDGQPIGADLGPFRLVVPSDKRGERWVGRLVKLRVVSATR